MSNQNSAKRNNTRIVPSKGGNRGQQQLARSNPSYLANNLDKIFDDFRTSFNELMTPMITDPFLSSPSLIPEWSPALPDTLPARYPVLDVVDEEDHYAVTAELPGFNKENIDIQVGDDVLQLTAQVQSERKGGRYISQERAYSAFQRAIQFPEQIVANKVEGTMKDGILQLRIPKKEPTSSKFTKVSLK